MASAAHQRRIWDVADWPIIGLAFDRFGFGVQVMIGHFDERDMSPDYCLTASNLVNGFKIHVLPSPDDTVDDLSWLSRLLTDPIITTCLKLAVEDVQYCAAIDMEQHYSSCENAWRSPWDSVARAIFNRFANEVTTGASVQTERTLRLPRIDRSVYDDDRPLKDDVYAFQVMPLATKLEGELIYERRAVEQLQRSLLKKGSSPERTKDSNLWWQAASQAVGTWRAAATEWGFSRKTRRSQDIECSEPRTARCDSLLMVNIHGFFKGTKASKNKLDLFGLIDANPLSVGTPHTVVDRAALRKVDPIGDNPLAAGSYRDGTTTCFSASMSHAKPYPSVPSSPIVPAVAVRHVVESMKSLRIDNESILISLTPFLCEFKATLRALAMTAAAQTRLDVVAAVKFLAVLGILDFPVFGLVTEGAAGYVIMAWGEEIEKDEHDEVGEEYDESKDIRVRIIDRHPVAFDLGTEVGAFHYACFLARIAHDLVPELARRVEAKREEFNERAREYGLGSSSLVWNMTQVWHERDKKTKEKEAAAAQARTAEMTAAERTAAEVATPMPVAVRKPRRGRRAMSEADARSASSIG
ncbi:hypothetical protein K488DRAFT_87204 [Vararia minispora EC-137]|uniref:Uncharacterized protein n=1 Tax=Vararia minispora EC-137 TaxID=1314806 RepID=A0ACB8QGW3_9AGAM|nr:hypothetical protein K488DRAFT_87204 [Vararia minispora EC-137]